MRLASFAFSFAILSLGAAACVDATDDGTGEDLGDIGDGKADSFGIVDRAVTIAHGHSKIFTFTADASFKVAVTQPDTASADRPNLTLSLKKPDATTDKSDEAAEPTLVLDEVDAGSYKLTIKNVGSKDAKVLLNVRPVAGFDGLPNPNAAEFPPVEWQPPAVEQWPSNYVIFNNPGCGYKCTSADSTAQASRSVMIKMLVTAIHSVKDGGIVRVSNFNISSSASTKPVADALDWARTERHATIRIIGDQAQNIPTSRTTQFATDGADVRFLDGFHYNGSSVGIMHSKMVIVDDKIVLTGSNNFSSTGFIINEENSVVLTGAANADRIRSYTCDIDTMFEAGVAAGQPQKTDAERKDSVAKLDACNSDNVFFPPSGVIATGDSITYNNVVAAIRGAKKSIDIAPDMLAHPGLVTELTDRATKAKAAGTPFKVRLVLDASDEALGNPAFGECLTKNAAANDLDMEVRYWPGTLDAFQLNHHKFMIIDAGATAGSALYNGSANYSAKALKWSWENVARYPGSQYKTLVDTFAARFDHMFSMAKDAAKLKTEDNRTAPACPF
ncbi:MAG TPA: phospholipase D-like domain-containing protein [Kofleriaceae bacterium]